ncbi:unnamed protein product, partial [Discosporangium mesarthrocarpum]
MRRRVYSAGVKPSCMCFLKVLLVLLLVLLVLLVLSGPHGCVYLCKWSRFRARPVPCHCLLCVFEGVRGLSLTLTLGLWPIPRGDTLFLSLWCSQVVNTMCRAPSHPLPSLPMLHTPPCSLTPSLSPPGRLHPSIPPTCPCHTWRQSQRLGVLPDELNRLLIGVVVLSMALTPALSNLGDMAVDFISKRAIDRGGGMLLPPPALGLVEGEGKGIKAKDTIVICGFGPVGQIVASLVNSPVIASELGNCAYVAFDLNPTRVRQSSAQGCPIFYGDGSQPEVLRTAGFDNPKALVVTYRNNEAVLQAVERLRDAFPGVPIFTRAPDYEQYLRLQDAGSTAVVSDLSEISIRLGSELLEEFGVSRTDEVQSAKADLRQTLVELARKGDARGQFSARFTPAMLSQEREREAVAKEGPGVGGKWNTTEDLGVSLCLLPEQESLESNGGSEGAEEGVRTLGVSGGGVDGEKLGLELQGATTGTGLELGQGVNREGREAGVLTNVVIEDSVNSPLVTIDTVGRGLSELNESGVDEEGEGEGEAERDGGSPGNAVAMADQATRSSTVMTGGLSR